MRQTRQGCHNFLELVDFELHHQSQPLLSSPSLARPGAEAPPACRLEGKPRPSSSSRRVSGPRPRLAAPRVAAQLGLTSPPSRRHRHVPGQGPDRLQHQCLPRGPGHHQAHAGPLRRRPAHGRRQRQADHHQRWRHRHEGRSRGAAPAGSWLTQAAPRHRPPRRPHPRRHRPLPGRRGGRRHDVGCRARRRDTQGGQGPRRAGRQPPDHHQGPAESVADGRQQDQGDCPEHRRGQPPRDAVQAGRHGHDEQADQAQHRLLHKE